jgi:hypothetical protein
VVVRGCEEGGEERKEGRMAGIINLITLITSIPERGLHPYYIFLALSNQITIRSHYGCTARSYQRPFFLVPVVSSTSS